VAENVEIVRGILSRWGEGDFGNSDSLDPEIEFETFMPDAGQDVTAHGVDELAAFGREWLSTWRSYRMIAEEFRDVGDDRVFVSVRQAAVGEHSGVEVDSPGFSVWTLRAGKVTKLSLHYDREAALEAAGIED
jgi:ketosteroid isomerase-like protein